MAMADEVRALAEEYVGYEENAEFRAPVAQLLAAGDTDALRPLMVPRITFGTSGLRGPMRGGFSGMNDLTVLQATQGLAAALRQRRGGAAAAKVSVVVGHDHRFHSAGFAAIVARVLASNGIHVIMLEEQAITPLVPFATQMYAADAGVMITASHNPARDNGYKLYGADSCAIVPPADKEIQAQIMQHLAPAPPAEGYARLIDARFGAAFAAYVDFVQRKCPQLAACQGRAVVYTPLHGVGSRFVDACVSGSAFRLSKVASQDAPDPAFPTLKFPNPEEAGTLDAAMAAADAKGIGFLVANDPDADRLGAAEKQADNTWHTFTGNELAAVFAKAAIDEACGAGMPLDRCAMVSTVVSSRLVPAMCARHGVRHEGTLTGFKWIGSKAAELARHGYNVLFSFEEALGYMFGADVLDKDGVVAACRLLCIYDRLAAQGLSLAQYLDSIYDTYGHFASRNSYFVCRNSQHGTRIINKVMRGVTEEGGQAAGYPAKLGPLEVDRIIDPTKGFDSGTSDHKATLPTTPTAEMVVMFLDKGSVSVSIRGSGTESKIKYYIESTAATEQEAIDKSAQVEAYVTSLFDLPANDLRPAYAK